MVLLAEKKMFANFCSDEFWNLNETWNTDVPDFSTCFQDTIIVLLPCTIFSVLGLLNLFTLSWYNTSAPLPWSWRIILKLLLSWLLFAISVSLCSIHAYQTFSEGSDFVSTSTITASVARSVTYIIIIAMMLKHRSYGITTSVVLSVFWLCFAFGGIVMHRSIIVKHPGSTSLSWSYILGMTYYPIIYIELIMSFFADKRSIASLESDSPFDEAPFISSILFLWFNKIIYRGWKKALTVTDFLPLPKKLQASYLYGVFSNHWKFDRFGSKLQHQSLAWVLFKSFWIWLLAAFVLDVLFAITILLPALMIDQILEFVKDDHYYWRLYYYCALIFAASLLCKVIYNNYFMYVLMALCQVKSTLISAIYKKNLVLATSERKNYNSGTITSMVSVDVERIANFALYATKLFTAPFRIILIIIFMWEYLGPSVLAGIAVIVLLFPVTFITSRISEKLINKQMMIKDTRIKYINEILNGIKILKFYAWEVPFSTKLLKTRKEEIKLICWSQLCYDATTFVFLSAPILVSIAIFTTYLLINPLHILDPARAFVSLNLLEQLKFALCDIPDALSELIQTITSVTRIRTFLLAKEVDPNIVGSTTTEGDAVTIKNATFFWSEDRQFVLENINLNIPTRKLVAVIGPVGAGKSSLLTALLGDMYKSSGSIDVAGTFAYVPQEAWILNRTLKYNIILEKKMNESMYSKILDCCCLRPDLEILPGKDETEIGEKGINLSGGQKQRVSLARAIYQNRDVYLLDDPLSAVDAHVRKFLIEDVVGNQGLLRNKTRILVTHDISVLPNVDFIVRMEEGSIVEIGTYKDLMNRSKSFKDFIKTHSYADENISVESESTTNEDHKAKISLARTISEHPSETKECAFSEEATLIEEEKMEEGSVKKSVYFNYAKHMGWLLLLLTTVGYVTYTSFQAGSNIWVSKWSADPVTNGTQDTSQTTYRLTIYGCLGFAQAISIVLGTAALVYGSTKAAELYHNQMLDCVLKAPMSFFDVTPMGRIVNRFSTDMDTLDIHIIYNIHGWVTCALYCIATFIVIGMNTPLFFACMLPLVFLYYLFMRLHIHVSRQLKRLESTTRSPIFSHLLESIYGVMSIKAFQVEKDFTEKLEEKVDNHIGCFLGRTTCNRWLHFWLDFIGSMVILVATLLALLNRHELGTSVVGLIITYALGATDAMMWFVQSNNELENKSVAIERVNEYCQLQPEAPRYVPDHDPHIFWPREGGIVFENYSTRYRENLDLVLKNINLNLLPGEKVGIVGRTGAGKSTVTLALFRIIEPATGTIWIDNVDLSKIGLYALRTKLTIIPQDPMLFTGSLRFNLDPNNEYEDSEIWKSLSNAHLRDFVSSLSEGLQHSVEEGGSNLSAGQKQLLCLARALLKKSKILILDEATAAVDMDTDKLVQDTIKTAFTNHTVITIAHRLNTVMDYDKIVVMDSGEIVEVGSPSRLLENQESCFSQLARKTGLA